jgi:thioredoxin-related protein
MVFLHINTENDTTKNDTNKLDKFIEDNKKIFALIYMEGCGPCNKVRPEWKKIENVLEKQNNNIVIVDINQELLKYVNNLKGFEPDGFPTILYITNRGEKIEHYDEDTSFEDNYDKRTIDSFIEWIKSKEKQTQQGGKWTLKYKRSINCRKPKGFSQKQYCKYTRKRSHKRKTHKRKTHKRKTHKRRNK